MTTERAPAVQLMESPRKTRERQVNRRREVRAKERDVTKTLNASKPPNLKIPGS